MPLAERVVEVIADLGPHANPRFRYGSGCRVVGRTVLTAAHVVASAHAVSVRGPDKLEQPAELDPAFVGDPEGPGAGRAPDFALLTVPGGPQVAPLPLAAVDRDGTAGEPIWRCHAVGYPEFAERPGSAGSVRDTVHTHGHIPVLSQLVSGLLTLQVSSSPRDLPPAGRSLEASSRSGMSGAPVLADGHLVGVVTEHAPRAGPSAITVTPLTGLNQHPAHPGWGSGVANPAAWWGRLGAPGNARRLATPSTGSLASRSCRRTSMTPSPWRLSSPEPRGGMPPQPCRFAGCGWRPRWPSRWVARYTR
jgi:Trypsin-like peptidase domain